MNKEENQYTDAKNLKRRMKVNDVEKDIKPEDTENVKCDFEETDQKSQKV